MVGWGGGGLFDYSVKFELIKAPRVHFQGGGGSFVKFTCLVSYNCSNQVRIFPFKRALLLTLVKLAKVGVSEV